MLRWLDRLAWNGERLKECRVPHQLMDVVGRLGSGGFNGRLDDHLCMLNVLSILSLSCNNKTT